MTKTLITGTAQSVSEIAKRAAEAAGTLTAAVTGPAEKKQKASRAAAKANTSSSSTKRSSPKKTASKAKKSKK